MYENLQSPPASRSVFLRRVAVHFCAASLLVASSLLLGMAGYQYFEGLEWRDAFLNVAMLLGGMGPVNAPQTPGGKIFAGLYALYAGLVFLFTVGIVFAPMLHRLLHRFHWDAGKDR